ncbi:hypothetical protein Tco_0485319 [Tanacetum coccineum]|uniref:Uncharacterized protein n=1 Tax=Tanacetum coccineum TaxID=301880 RepID=A0ABQ4YUC3_9ASTR
MKDSSQRVTVENDSTWMRSCMSASEKEQNNNAFAIAETAVAAANAAVAKIQSVYREEIESDVTSIATEEIERDVDCGEFYDDDDDDRMSFCDVGLCWGHKDGDVYGDEDGWNLVGGEMQ